MGDADPTATNIMLPAGTVELKEVLALVTPETVK
jgi:hypothetical protein